MDPRAWFVCSPEPRALPIGRHQLHPPTNAVLGLAGALEEGRGLRGILLKRGGLPQLGVALRCRFMGK